ncbi:RNA polymerase factor sigma-54 [Candidatus Margulisiibacteriota bacterium]
MNITAKLTLNQTLKLQQILTPKLIQMLNTFQLSYNELVNIIEKENQENVFVEIKRQDQLLPNYAASNRGQSSSTFLGNEFIDASAQVKASDGSMYEYLVGQLKFLELRDKENRIAKILIENIDKRGYLPNYPEVKEGIIANLQVKERKVHDVLKIIHTFEPEGIGARDLRECLLVQINEYNFQNEELRSILKKVVQNHLEELGNKNYEKIAKKLRIEKNAVENIAIFIKENLNPVPGNIFKNTRFDELIVPSFEVKIENGQLVLINLEQKIGIGVNLSQNYLQVINDPKIDPKTKEYLAERLKKAKELIQNIEKRYENIEKLVNFIIDRQEEFIKKGDAYLRPLLQKDISQHLDVSAPTVSRIVAAKYIHTPNGIYSLKALCPRSYFGKTANKIKQIIQDVFKENPGLSDQKIREILEQKSIDMARRTVAKYRLELGIGSVFTR